MWKTFRKRRISPQNLLDHYGIRYPPIDVEAIANAMGLRIIKTPEPGWSGALDLRYDPPVIWLDEKENVLRNRFTIAHELGHLIKHSIPGVKEVFRDSNFRKDFQDSQANKWAANLLMPPGVVLAVQRKKSIAELVDIFQVSKAAMGYMLMKLGLC